MAKKKGKGWHGQSKRHSIAAKKGAGKGKRKPERHTRKSTKSTRGIAWSGGNKPASGKGLTGKARYKRIAETTMHRVMQIQRNRPMKSLSKRERKKVTILAGKITKYTMKANYARR